MNQSLDEMVQAIAETVFEGLAFVFVLTPEEASPANGTMVSASVGFEGEYNGTVAISVSEPLLSAIAANMLGASDAAGLLPAQLEDALKELANVLGGPIVAAMAGSRPVPRLLPPKFVGCSPLPGEPAAKTQMFFDDGEARVTLFLANGRI